MYMSTSRRSHHPRHAPVLLSYAVARLEDDERRVRIAHLARRAPWSRRRAPRRIPEAFLAPRPLTEPVFICSAFSAFGNGMCAKQEGERPSPGWKPVSCVGLFSRDAEIDPNHRIGSHPTSCLGTMALNSRPQPRRCRDVEWGSVPCHSSRHGSRRECDNRVHHHGPARRDERYSCVLR